MKTFTTAATLLMLSMSPASYAGDDKTYPGSFCHLFLEEDPVLDEVKLVCPIVRDNTENKNGVKLALVRVFNNDDRISCTLQSETAGGKVIARKTATTEDTGVRTLNVTVKKSVKQGYYNMYCTVPCLEGVDAFCGSGIVSYRVLEHTAAEDLHYE